MSATSIISKFWFTFSVTHTGISNLLSSSELGYEQLGQRGCPTSNIPSLDIDMKASLSIGVRNWIGVYLRSCLPLKMSKQRFPYIGLEIGLGHIPCVISFLDIDIDTYRGD